MNHYFQHNIRQALGVFLLLSIVLFSTGTHANDRGATQYQTTPQLYALELDQAGPVLTSQDYQSLELSQAAAEANRYPVQDGDRTLHLYGSGQPTLICALMKVCTIELQAGEKVAKNGINLGDTVRWKVSPSIGEGDKTFLMIKPVGVGLETNLVIVTDKHHYDVRLVSRHDVRISKLAWSYPNDTQQAWKDYYTQTKTYQQQQHQTQQTVTERETLPDTRHTLSQLDFNYGLSGCEQCHWRPIRVYNDGRQTVVEFPDLTGKEAPALLVASHQGDRIVNYRIEDNRYLVDNLFDQAFLLLGVGATQQRITITRLKGKQS